MLSFVRSFKYYMSNEIVQPYWDEFEENLTKVEDLDQVLEFQAKFLDSVMKDCLLSNRTLLCMMSQLLDTVRSKICVRRRNLVIFGRFQNKKIEIFKIAQ